MLEECIRTFLANPKIILAKEQARTCLLAAYPTSEDFAFANKDVEGILHNCLTVDEQNTQARKPGFRKMAGGADKDLLQSKLRTISKKLKRWHDYLLGLYEANAPGKFLSHLHFYSLVISIVACR